MTQSPSPLQAKPGDILLLVGTTKGAFLFRSSGSRTRWQASGPHFPGQSIYSLAFDGRQQRRRIWAGVQNPWYGTGLQTSDDFGGTWNKPETPNLQFPTDTGVSLKQIWQIAPGRAEEPDVLYCGVEPAALFESRDAGVTWSLVRGLYDHPQRPQWNPGGGGLCLHTIVPDPRNRNRMWIAVSSGGVYRTDDGGNSWRPTNQGVRADFMPDKYPEFGQCVHKIVLHPSHPNRLFMQNHGGLYRSDNGGEAWRDIAKGVPSDFGFPIVMHPHDPDSVYVVPLEKPEFRAVPEAKLRVFRTRNRGKSWEALTRGLPQRDAYDVVLRGAMDADSLRPAGIYFGTRSGKLYGSPNDGNSWQLIRDGLPPVVCVKAALVQEPDEKARPAAKKPASSRTARKPSAKPSARRDAKH